VKPVTVADALTRYAADLMTRAGDAGNVVRVRKHLPAGLKSKAVTLLSTTDLRRWRDGLAKKLAAASVNRTTDVPTMRAPAPTMRDPSGLQARESTMTGSVPTSSSASEAPVVAFHTHESLLGLRRSVGLATLAMRDPSGLQAMSASLLACPVKTVSIAPVCASQIRAVASKEAVAMRKPSRLQVALQTVSLCPCRTTSSAPGFASQIRAV
jgi:hypothetical protein